MSITDTPTYQPGDNDRCPNDMMEAIRATHKITKNLERAVTGDPYNPQQSPGLLREVESLKADLHEHIRVCRPRKTWQSKAWLAGAIAASGTLGHLVPKAFMGWLQAGAPTSGGGSH